MYLTGKINNIDDIKRISTVASQQDFDVIAESGNIMIDCRSFVNLFPLIGKEVNIVVEDNVDVKLFRKMFKKMKI